MFERTKAQLSRAVSTYRVSRKAVAKLAPDEEFGSWKAALLELKNKDVRGPGDEGAKSKSRFIQSWIWSTAPRTSISPSDPDLDAALRVEWCKAQERARCYEEEEELVIEEMRRTLVMFEVTACEWDKRSASPSLSTLDATAAIGVAAYGAKQAAMHRQLIDVFINDWYEFIKGNPLADSWLKNYTPPPKDSRHRLECNVKLFHSASTPVVARDVNETPFDGEEEVSADHDAG